MKAKISKKQIKQFQKKAAVMSDSEFKQEAFSTLGVIAQIVKEAMEQGKISSGHFYDSVQKEIDILSKMIESPEYTVEQKVEFANRIAALTDKLQQKDLIKEVGIFMSIAALIGTVVWFVNRDK